MQYGPAIKDIATLVDAVRFVSGLGANCWWRGQESINNRGLLPKAFRKPILRKYEESLAREFMLKAPTRYANCPQHDDLAGWLFLMQHYGLPTRLLDWSESPLVALFFAVREGLKEPGALFALNPMDLNGQQREPGSYIISADSEEARPLFARIFPKEKTEPCGILAIGTRQIDNRMLMQHAQFTIHDLEAPLQNLDYHNRFLFHFEVPAAAKPIIFRELFNLGIRESNLFPDLGSLAIDLIKTIENLGFCL